MPRREDDEYDDDDYDDRPRRRRRYDDDDEIEDDIGQDAGMRMLLPVGRSGWAIAAGYLGLVSVLMLPAPFALFTGIMALREIKKNPKKHGMGRAVFGIIMGGLFTALTGLILVLAILKGK